MLNFLIPNACVLCYKISPYSYPLCQYCESELPWLKNACLRCAQPLLDTVSHKICAKCIKKAPVFHKTIALFEYRFPIDLFVTQLKFNQKLIYANLLGQLLAKRIILNYTQDMLPEKIFPIPLHKRRLQERGFNQALEIAKVLSKTLSITVNKTDCIRLVSTLPQSSLAAHLRRKNIKNAFALKRKIVEKHIAIVDDVITTGETVSEVAKLFYRQGVERIDIWSCAHTRSISQQ